MLFELLIALTLIVVCLFPLVKPHASMRIAERKQLDEMELERIAQAAFCQLKIHLYEHRLHHWSDFKKKVEGSLSEMFTSSLGKVYGCQYTLEEVGHCNKPSQNKEGIVLDIQLRFPPSKTVFERTLYLEGLEA